MPSESPRIVTDERVPCAVFSGHLRQAHEFEAAIGRRLERVTNVYNCPAFAMDKGCTEVISLNGVDEVSLVLFLATPIVLDETIDLKELREHAAKASSLINSIIGRKSRSFKFERFWVEYTGRNPN
jgi:hypothetical protein